jgi:hypothetical protein
MKILENLGVIYVCWEVSTPQIFFNEAHERWYQMYTQNASDRRHRDSIHKEIVG